MPFPLEQSRRTYIRGVEARVLGNQQQRYLEPACPLRGSEKLVAWESTNRQGLVEVPIHPVNWYYKTQFGPTNVQVGWTYWSGGPARGMKDVE